MKKRLPSLPSQPPELTAEQWALIVACLRHSTAAVERNLAVHPEAEQARQLLERLLPLTQTVYRWLCGVQPAERLQ